MFDKIDNFLITWFQWGVRQFELYTKFERNDLVKASLLFFKVMIFSYIIVSTIKKEISIDTVFTLDIFTCLMLMVLYFVLKVSFSKQKNTTNVLPVEILTHKPLRWFSFLNTFIVIPLVFYLSFLLFSYISLLNQEKLVVILSALVFSLNIIMIFYLEYLLCTISLPPGEKRKIMERKEMKQMQAHLIPIRIQK